uniref:Uncharacterized protein n=1 Tax=Anguilla anguilla TaxID=7936 RepID=A0A0E9RFF2_ANGAN
MVRQHRQSNTEKNYSGLSTRHPKS